MRVNPLEAIIRQEITAKGPLSFARFMEYALYHPQFGYYCAGGEHIGPSGDFVTSPMTHPAFGGLIARQIRQMWECLGRPADFTIVEMGAGNGRLCRDILLWLRRFFPRFFHQLHYRLIEPSAVQRARQQENLRSFGAGDTLEFSDSLEELAPESVEGCFLSNELVDAFPVHRVVKQAGHLRELYVTLADDQLVEVLGDPSTVALEEHLRWEAVGLTEGNYAEVNLRGPLWMGRVAASLRQGFMLTIDYGYRAEELYAPDRREGSLLGYRGHGYKKDLLRDVGQQDLTAHVDFTSLIKAGEEADLRLEGLVTQREFLLRLSLAGYARALQGLHLAAPELRANIRAMDELAHPEKLGRLKVLVQSKGVEACHLAGLEGEEAPDGYFQPRAQRLPRLPWRASRRFGSG